MKVRRVAMLNNAKQEYVKSLDLLNAAKRQSRDIYGPKHEYMAMIYYLKAIVYNNAKKYDAAFKCISKAKEVLEGLKISNNKLYGYVHMIMGIIHYHKEQYEDALKSFQIVKTLDLEKDGLLGKLIPMLNYYEGLAYYNLVDFDMAQECFKLAEELLPENRELSELEQRLKDKFAQLTKQIEELREDINSREKELERQRVYLDPHKGRNTTTTSQPIKDLIPSNNRQLVRQERIINISIYIHDMGIYINSNKDFYYINRGSCYYQIPNIPLGLKLQLSIIYMTQDSSQQQQYTMYIHLDKKKMDNPLFVHQCTMYGLTIIATRQQDGQSIILTFIQNQKGRRDNCFENISKAKHDPYGKYDENALKLIHEIDTVISTARTTTEQSSLGSYEEKLGHKTKHGDDYTEVEDVEKGYRETDSKDQQQARKNGKIITKHIKRIPSNGAAKKPQPLSTLMEKYKCYLQMLSKESGLKSLKLQQLLKKITLDENSIAVDLIEIYTILLDEMIADGFSEDAWLDKLAKALSLYPLLNMVFWKIVTTAQENPEEARKLLCLFFQVGPNFSILALISLLERLRLRLMKLSHSAAVDKDQLNQLISVINDVLLELKKLNENPNGKGSLRTSKSSPKPSPTSSAQQQNEHADSLYDVLAFTTVALAYSYGVPLLVLYACAAYVRSRETFPKHELKSCLWICLLLQSQGQERKEEPASNPVGDNPDTSASTSSEEPAVPIPSNPHNALNGKKRHDEDKTTSSAGELAAIYTKMLSSNKGFRDLNEKLQKNLREVFSKETIDELLKEQEERVLHCASETKTTNKQARLRADRNLMAPNASLFLHEPSAQFNMQRNSKLNFVMFECNIESIRTPDVAFSKVPPVLGPAEGQPKLPSPQLTHTHPVLPPTN